MPGRGVDCNRVSIQQTLSIWMCFDQNTRGYCIY